MDKNIVNQIEQEASRQEKIEKIRKKISAQEEDGYDGFSNTKIKRIPSPNFSDCGLIGTFLPVNMADETVTKLSEYSQDFDFLDFIREQLNYTTKLSVCNAYKSEQIDAMVLAIKSFEKNNGFILGDMAGIGKGRVCAGILRFAIQKGFIPVFVTHKPYLFNDFFRDLVDIGGLGKDSNGKLIPFKPLILHPDGVIKRKVGVDEDGNAIFNVIAEPPPNKDLVEMLKETTQRIGKTNVITLPSDYNCVFLPYSTLAMTRGFIKQNFLEAIAPKSLLIFDESHNAASANLKSNVLTRALPLVEKSKGVLFSSATYAKTPAVFNLYIVKTALRTAVPSLESILGALKVGGENVAEYIASGLVKEGQMIRRVRDFGNCKKKTLIVGTKRTEVLGEAKYTDELNDTQKDFYNEAINYFKQLRDFSKSEACKTAILYAIQRKCLQTNYEVADMNEYSSILKTVYLNENEERVAKRTFINENFGKYVVKFSPDSISRYKQVFRENLFLALKAKYSADEIIKCLKDETEYTNIDGKTFFAPQKPLVAVRNTGEAIFNELKLKVGEKLNNDFSEYLRAIYLKLFSGTFTLRRVDDEIFESLADLKERNIDPVIVKLEYLAELEDFSDFSDLGQTSPRQRLINIQNSLDAYQSQLPFSFIDYLRDRIESEKRNSVYFDANGQPKYGFASSENFRFIEATSRNFMLKKLDGESQYTYLENDRPSTVTDAFAQFNDGKGDVMLINVAASTGGSAHSSPSEGRDTRPRNMFIIQFEPDINVEVQKRGRVNRTGQLNYPTYTYVITQIPVEYRTYLMFRKKLRKLDANTSADQTASAESVEITDKNGKIIEDILNQYGYHVFRDDFIDEPEFLDYKSVFNSVIGEQRTKINKDTGEAEKVEINIEQFNAFIRELELYPTDFQQKFFDEMNERYLDYIIELDEKGEYQLELTAKDYQASIRQSNVIQLNSGSSIFSLPLFQTDYYVINDKKPYSKQKVMNKANELALNVAQHIGISEKQVDPKEIHRRFIQVYIEEFDKESQIILDNYTINNEPKRENFSNNDDFDAANIRFQATRFSLDKDNRWIKEKMLDYLTFFTPMKPVVYRGIVGRFLGLYIKKSQTKFRFSKSNMQLVFCFLSTYPRLNVKFEWNIDSTIWTIKSETTDIGRPQQNPEGAIMSGNLEFLRLTRSNLTKEQLEDLAEDWIPDLSKRTIKRFYTGNILSGIVRAELERKTDDGPTFILSRFVNIDGSKTTAIELNYNERFLESEKPDKIAEYTPLVVSADNSNLIDLLNEIPISTGENENSPLANAMALRNFSKRKTVDVSKVTYPIWNALTDDIIERGIAVIKLTGAEYRVFLRLVICQPIITSKNKLGKVVYKEPESTSTKYNEVYHNENLLRKYTNYFNDIDSKDFVELKYAVSQEWINNGWKFKRETYLVKTKVYDFYETDFDDLRNMLTDIYRGHGLNFEFTSSAADVLNVGLQEDPYDIQKKDEKKEEIYKKDRYTYRLKKPMADSILQTLPDFLEKVDIGFYGGAVFAYPLPPIKLKSFEMLPVDLPNDVIVKLVFSVLSDADKGKVAEQLEKNSDKEPRAIGEYIQQVLRRILPSEYFFGDLTLSQYGLIFKEYALKKDLSKLVIPEEQIQEKAKILKDKVTFEDAERFLLLLNP